MSEEGCHRAFQVICLAAEQHEIEGRTEVFGQHSRRLRNSRIAEAAPHGETRAGQLGSAPGPDKEGHLLICLKQPAAKIAADRAHANHEGTHISAPYNPSGLTQSWGRRALILLGCDSFEHSTEIDRVPPASQIALDLCHTAIDEQLDAGD